MTVTERRLGESRLADEPANGGGPSGRMRVESNTSDPARSLAATPRPALAEGVELIGEYEGSGFKEPPSLVRRPDGQVIQLPPLLYSVAAKADGNHTTGDIARSVTEEIRRGITANQVDFLVDEKLRPLGILAAADGSSPAIEKPDPFLGLRFRAAVISERISNALGVLFMPLFFGPVVLAVLAGLVAADIWLFARHGVAQAIRQSIVHPGLFLPLFGAVVLSAAFHETGHAAGCRYGGGRPGKMGCGLYLAWPAFYTDVTDAYRLGRRARLRTDLGGVYFNVVVVLITVGAYFATHFEPFLLLVIIQHFEIAHQLLPVVRLDGYYIVADLTGVPDLFSRIGPILRSLVPWHKTDQRVTVLKRWVRFAVTGWVLVVVPLLLLELLLVLVHLPRILSTGWDSGVHQYNDARHAFAAGHFLSGATAAIQLIVLAIPIVGILLMIASAGRRSASAVWRGTSGRPVLRGVAMVAGAAAVAALLSAWIPKSSYTPIRPGERGTIADGVADARHLPQRHGAIYTERRAARRASLVPASRATDRAKQAPSASTATTTEPTLRSATTETPEVSPSASSYSSAGGSSPSTTAAPETTTTTEPSTTTSTEPSTTTTSEPSTTTTSSPTSTTAP